MNNKANRPVSGLGSHALTISTGVKILNDSQVAVTIFEGGRFRNNEAVIIAIAEEALRSAPETAFDRWTGPLVWYSTPYPDGSPDHTVKVQFVKIKEKK